MTDMTEETNRIDRTDRTDKSLMEEKEKVFYAHSRAGKTESVSLHLQLVSKRASEYAAAFGASIEAELAGLLHDIGKYGELFQKRLQGEVSGIDHWSAGAWLALEKYKQKGIASALAIQGHHVGLQGGEKNKLTQLSPQYLQTDHPLGLKLSETDLNKLLTLLKRDNLEPVSYNELPQSLYDWNLRNVASMLDVRMLFSCLVDADFIETEAWFKSSEAGKRQYREPGLSLEPEKAFSRLKEHLSGIASESESDESIKRLRAELLKNCLDAAYRPPGLFTLTAPTGSGKTLSMLAFALSHAAIHKLKRVIIVIPYLTIIEQTAKAYRKVFEPYFLTDDIDKYILEHHSLSGVKKQSNKIIDDTYQQNLLAENWDAPVTITTNVQFLESLFSNRPSTCRKLHNISNSVILFDEAQSLPINLAVPTLAALSHLAERYHSSIVFATATQPAFSHLDRYVKTQCFNGWQPREVVPNNTDLFEKARRLSIFWPEQNSSISWTRLAAQLAELKQVLCVVNLKKHAQAFFQELKTYNPDSTFHISTNMCPAHRQLVLDTVSVLLEKGQPCYLISTQCIEAGVDIDFPVVYRSMGPLDAIAQTAGRCNRNGHLKSGGRMQIFYPEVSKNEIRYPDKGYAQGSSITEILLNQFSNTLDINKPDIFSQYYKLLYQIRAIGTEDKAEDPLLNAIARQDFIAAKENYNVIDQDTINVLVPYDKKIEIYHLLRKQALNEGLSRQWILKARPYTVSLFRPRKADDPLYQSLEPINLKFNKKEEESTEWYIYRVLDDYDPGTGLNPSKSQNAIIA